MSLSPLPFNNLNGLYSKTQFTNHTFGTKKPSYWAPSTLDPAVRLLPTPPKLDATIRAQLMKPKPGFLAYTTGPLIFLAAGYQMSIQTCRHWALQFGFYDHYFNAH